jgi:hypothetical protein
MVRQPTPPPEFWFPDFELFGPDRAITIHSAALVRDPERDTIRLYVDAELAADFAVPSGLGEQLLRQLCLMSVADRIRSSKQGAAE